MIINKYVYVLIGLIMHISVLAQKPQKATINVPGMKCEACENIIMQALYPKIDGITQVIIKWKSKTVKVTYLPDRIDLGNIKNLIALQGFQADEEEQDVEYMKKLPACCQLPYVPKIIAEPNPVPNHTVAKPVAPIVNKSNIPQPSAKPTLVKPTPSKVPKPAKKG